MIQSCVRQAVVCCGVIGAVLATPSESQAIFHWFGNCCRPQTTYMPVAPAVNCNPCGTQVAQYVPQTCYRQECVQVPVTVMQPSTSCDPCSCCPVTTMRPVTVMQQQVRMVPYTTYRIVYSNPSPCGTCATGCGVAAAPAASTYYYQAAAPAMAYPAAPSTSSCCGGSAAPASYSAPAATYSAPMTSPQPTYSTPAPSLSTPPATTTPPASTYESGRANTTDPNAPLTPIPQPSNGASSNSLEGNTSGTNYGPSFAPPAASRATSAPVQRAWMIRPVSGAAPVSAPPAWLQSQRATPMTSTNTASASADAWRPSVR
jgi:hypothetical protein